MLAADDNSDPSQILPRGISAAVQDAEESVGVCPAHYSVMN
jgi:hypothetical protein